MARGAQALIVRVSLGHILLTPMKSLGSTHQRFSWDRHPHHSARRSEPTFPQAQADRYDTLGNMRDPKEMYNSKRSAIDVSDGTLVFLLTWGRTHLSLIKYGRHCGLFRVSDSFSRHQFSAHYCLSTLPLKTKTSPGDRDATAANAKAVKV